MAKVYDTATDLITFARLQAQNTTSGSSYLGSDGLLKFAAEDEPRIEYGSDGSLKGLLIEEQRTNLVTYSEDFSNAGWSKNGSTAIDSTLVTGPDGTLSGRRLLNFDSETGDRLVEVVSVSNATITGSIWVKGEGANVGKDITLVVKRNGGTFVADTLNHTLSSEWVRLDGTFTQLPDNTGASLVLKHPENGNEASEVLIYGAQLEEGTFATSYIPTSGSTVTRSPDIASIPVSAFGYNQDAGTVVVEATAYAGNPNNANYASLGNAALTDFVRLWTWEGQTSHIRWTGTNFDVVIPFTSGTAEKFAGAYAQDNYNIALDGAAATPDTSGAQTLIGSVLRLGAKTSATEFLNGHIKSIQYYPRRLTDAQLQELTA